MKLEFHEELTLKTIADFVKRVAELEAQNAELLEVLKFFIADSRRVFGDAPMEALAKASKAIAKAEGRE